MSKVVKLPVVRIERDPAEVRMSENAQLQAFADTLRKIARGRTDNGRPMASERARQIAREALIEWGVQW